jgi:hypothetical protein
MTINLYKEKMYDLEKQRLMEFKKLNDDNEKIKFELLTICKLNGKKHLNIICKRCRKNPIEGILYKCCECVDDYYLCEKCEEWNFIYKKHEHNFIKIRSPNIINKINDHFKIEKQNENHNKEIINDNLIEEKFTLTFLNDKNNIKGNNYCL